MPAALPGSTMAQNLANPSLGVFVIFDPLSGPKGSLLDKGSVGTASTGALCTGIGIGENDIIGVRPNASTAPAAIFSAGFNDNDTPGTVPTYAAPPPNGVVASSAINSTRMYIGGGKCTANVNGIAPPVPYTSGIILCGAGNGGARDAGAGPVFQGFGMKMVTAVGTVAVGGVVETGWVNRSTRSLVATESIFGSAVAASGAPS